MSYIYTQLACFLMACGAVSSAFLPPGQLAGYTSSGGATVGAAASADYQRLRDALANFVPVNASCRARANASVEACRSCVSATCRSSAEDKCSNFLTDTIKFFTADLPNFFSDTVPGAFVDLGEGVVDLGELALGEIVDFGKDFGNDLEGVGSDIEGLAIDFTSDLVDFGDFLKGKIIDPVIDIGEGLGNLVLDLGRILDPRNLGRKKRSLTAVLVRKRRSTVPTSEPSCQQLQDNSSYYCLYYTRQCTNCTFDADNQCPGWTSTVSAVQAASELAAWVVKAANKVYKVLAVEYDFSNSGADGISGCVATTHLFGVNYTFTVSEGMNLFDSMTTGGIIANYTLAAARAASIASK